MFFTPFHVSLSEAELARGWFISPGPSSAPLVIPLATLGVTQTARAPRRTCSFCILSRTTFLSRRRCRSETSSTWWKTCRENHRERLGIEAAALPHPLLPQKHLTNHTYLPSSHFSFPCCPQTLRQVSRHLLGMPKRKSELSRRAKPAPSHPRRALATSSLVLPTPGCSQSPQNISLPWGPEFRAHQRSSRPME